jgi:hypothetical protein
MQRKQEGERKALTVDKQAYRSLHERAETLARVLQGKEGLEQALVDKDRAIHGLTRALQQAALDMSALHRDAHKHKQRVVELQAQQTDAHAAQVERARHADATLAEKDATLAHLTALLDKVAAQSREAEHGLKDQLAQACKAKSELEEVLEKQQREGAVLRIAVDHGKAEATLLKDHLREFQQVHLELATLKRAHEHVCSEAASLHVRHQSLQDSQTKMAAQLAISVSRDESDTLKRALAEASDATRRLERQLADSEAEHERTRALQLERERARGQDQQQQQQQQLTLTHTTHTQGGYGLGSRILVAKDQELQLLRVRNFRWGVADASENPYVSWCGLL